MRILTLSNLYPPHYVGGYELGCQQVMEQLTHRGHEVTVLTSCYGVNRPVVEGNVWRLLESCPIPIESLNLFTLICWQRAHRAVLCQLLNRVRPDVVSVWNLGGLASNALLTELWRRRIPTVICASDYWLRNLYTLRPDQPWLRFWEWQPSEPIKRWAKKVMRRMAWFYAPTTLAPLDWRRVYFVSQTLKQHYAKVGLPVADSPVIYWGVAAERFQKNRSAPTQWHSPSVRLLFAGRLVPEKGAHTVLNALSKLQGRLSCPVTLSIVGSESAEYESALRQQAQRLNGCCAVEFCGQVAHAQMPDVYRAHDVFVLPSIWEEPFSIALLEAMASGLCVVGTTTGGSAEILQHEVNGLTFKPDDAEDLARQLQRVIEDASLRQRLAAQGRRTVRERFTLTSMVDQIESLLCQTAADGVKL
ncbi:MAG: glycosyltransferase family 4 protein [Abditibacteriales bacterium]|nr:glycosyltransferase family 4 protein [Abditibacteriales bacterium]